MSEEIKKVHFNRSPEGYSVEDVDRYVEQINGEYLKLDGMPGNREETHFKIKKKEEM